MEDFPKIKLRQYDEMRPHIRNGDILVASGNYMFSKLIQKATNSCWSHVAFILRLDEIDRIMVLESVEGRGIRTIPLSEYIRNFEGTRQGYQGRLAIARHDQFKNKVLLDNLKKMMQFAVDRFAYPYDDEEIGRITARIIASKLGFNESEIKRNDEYICSEYVYECYRILGIEIEINESGFISPADFINDKQIKLLYELENSAVNNAKE